MADAKIVEIVDEFQGGRAWSSTTADTNGWNVRLHNGSGTVTAITPSTSGQVRLACDTTTAAQSVVLSDNDILWLSPNLTTNPVSTSLKLFQAVCYFNSTLDANTSGFIGLCSADNATLTSITDRVGFNIGASGEVRIDCVNPTVSNSAIDTLYALTIQQYYLFEINMANPSDVRFAITNLNNFNAFNVGRVLGQDTFDFHNYTGSLQRYFRIGKSAGTNATSMDVDRCRVVLKRN